MLEEEQYNLTFYHDRDDFLSHIVNFFDDKYLPLNKVINKYQIYNILLKYNWIIEVKKGTAAHIEFSPYAKTVIDFFNNFENLNKISYGQEIIKIVSLLDYAQNNTDKFEDAIKSAFTSAKLFTTHLSRISSHIHLYEQVFEKENSVRNVIFEFFENYMEKNFIEDFKKIKTTQSPFIYRNKIESLCEELLITTSSPEIRHILFEIQKLFSNIDYYLDILDKSSQRIEKKINNTIKFMTEINQVDNTNILKAIELITEETGPNSSLIFNENTMQLPQSPEFLFEERKYTSKKEITFVKEKAKNQEFEKRQLVINAYLQRHHITIEKISNFIEENIRKRELLQGSDYKISSLYEFFIFERIRSLSFIEHKKLSNKWQIDFLDSEIDNEWIHCKDFIIRRRR